ncbi:hypothetical protein RHSIM_RhsimUnG0020400 [Rhododendron simsii]|uniref:FCP1 homology domain-containing protein n=1 Tax=Rhododendron simsii TaxID=118357 RepID=A0A834FZK3_RHOSS|nr:hypothetical protein RHSIM_RhsimUnG0020400 [Rhododendron simsii]
MVDINSLEAISCLGSVRDGAGSSVLVMQECSVRDTSLQHSDEANGSGETQEMLGDTAAVCGNSLPVAGEILKGRACPGVELESGEQEVKNKMEKLNEIIDEQSVMKVDSVADPPGNDFQLGDTDALNVIPNAVQNVCSVKEIQDKSMTFCKEGKASYDAYGSYTSIEKLESDNLEIHPYMKETISSSSQLGGVTDDVSLAAVGKDGPQPMLQPPLERASTNNFGKKLLVLDVNGLLVDMVSLSHVSEGYHPDKTISGKAVFKRPFCDDFLQFCFERFHVGVWSSRIKNTRDWTMLTNEDIDLSPKIRRGQGLPGIDQSHCTDTGYNTLQNKDKPLVLKELRKLWEKQEPDLPWNRGDYNTSNTLLLDDSPYKALCNPAHTAIFPYPYQYKDVNDNTLGPGGDLRVYLERLASANNVQKYVEMNPFGQRPITETNLSWKFYLKVMNASSLQAEEDANNSSADQQRLTPNDLNVMNASTSQSEEDADNFPADEQRLPPNDLKVMDASTAHAEEDAYNSSADQQRITPNNRGMGFDARLPLHASHNQSVGFDSRDAVVAIPKTLPVAMPLPPDASNAMPLPPDASNAMPLPPDASNAMPLPSYASNTIYVEGLPPDSTRREVAHIFRHFPGYKHVRLVRKESRRRGGYYPYILGFVEFEDPGCAATALTALDGYKVDEDDPYSAYLRLEFSRSASESRWKRQRRYYDR